jgi:beta-lactam-binding protein with PASTA domain
LHREINNLIKFPVYVLVFILLGLLFGYLTFKILSFSRTVEVPSLYGKSLLESNKLLTGKGLYLKIEGEDYDPVVSPGHVIRQDIPPGNKVKEKRGIKVIISKGPRVKSIPVLVNETLFNAESLLLQKGLKISKVIHVHSDTIDKDRIIAQRPGPNEQISDYLTVLVSLGHYDKNYFCPDFRDMSFEKAHEIIKKLNLKMEVRGEGEMVETQKPEPGVLIKSGDTIRLKLY